MKDFIKAFFIVLLFCVVAACEDKTLSSVETMKEKKLKNSQTKTSSKEESSSGNYVFSLNSKTGIPEILGVHLNSDYADLEPKWSPLFPKVDAFTHSDGEYELEESDGHEWVYIEGEGGELDRFNTDIIKVKTYFLKKNPDKLRAIYLESQFIYGLRAAARWIDPKIFNQFKGEVYKGGGGSLFFSKDKELVELKFHRNNWDDSSQYFIAEINLIPVEDDYFFNKYYGDYMTKENKITLDEARSYLLKDLVASEIELKDAEKEDFIPDEQESETAKSHKDISFQDILYKEFIAMEPVDQQMYLDELKQANPQVLTDVHTLSDALNSEEMEQYTDNSTTVIKLIQWIESDAN
ncbi:hypothetical protein P8610_16845 [Fictibacillus sp. UD]|uniref:hypothetical protein n=1 Tax=Fictibacillus sp. UD TaxID=3038777 RepID=UPI003745319A